MEEEIFRPIGHDVPNYIKVVGVGGGGGNAVNHMMEEGILGVDFILCNTDYQALQRSSVTNRVHLGKRELGAGNDPNIGRESAEISKDEIASMIDDKTKMLFVTAGMGGGTGTGAAPVVARIAREKGILTVGIVTMPMDCEGRRRKLQAENGIEELRKYVDTLIVISTDKLRDQFGDMKLSEAFRKADDVLTTAAKGIAEIITVTDYVNVDFEDVKTVMKDSGKAIMGSGRAEGEGRAEKAIKEAISSPLLNDSDIQGAKNVLLHITSGAEEVSLDEVREIINITQDTCGNECDVIWGNGTDENLGNAIGVTLIATGFNREKKQSVQQQQPTGNNMDDSKHGKKVYGINGEIIQEAHAETAAETNTQTINRIKPEVKKPEPIVTPTPVEPVAEVHHIEEKVEPVATPQVKEEPAATRRIHTLNEDDTIDDTIDFTPTMPAPSPEPERVSASHPQAEEPTPTVKRYDNPFKHDDDNDGFEITSRFITNEELEARQAVTVSVVEEERPKTIDPKEELRKQRLRTLSMNFRSAKGLEELENQPAYLRRNVDISSSTSEDISHYSSSKNGLSAENSFLHDNVD